MTPLVVLVFATAVFRLAGALGAPLLADWLIATRLGLAVMFVFTGMAHFSKARRDFVSMVPPPLPAPRLIVTLTGLLQIALAFLLIWPDTSRAAAIALIVLLVLMFPANVWAARTAHTIAGRPQTPIVPRTVIQVAWIGLLAWSGVCTSCIRGDAGDPTHPVVVTADLHRFVALLTPDGITDTSCAGVRAYFAGATPGLEEYRRRFGVGPAELCAALRRVPQRYSELAERAAAYDSVGTEVTAAFVRFRALYPDARFAPVYVVVGNGISGGTAVPGRHPLILVGAELTNKTGGLTRTIVHELMHVQQDYPAWGAFSGGPEFIRGTLLRQAVKEGSADFLAELVLGPFRGTRELWGAAHEAELWDEFQHDMHGKDYSRWLYNGWNHALGSRPVDIGYYVGYRIAQAYYDHATDKRQAIRDILTIHDFDAFLAKSGYEPPEQPDIPGPDVTPEPVHIGA